VARIKGLIHDREAIDVSKGEVRGFAQLLAQSPEGWLSLISFRLFSQPRVPGSFLRLSGSKGVTCEKNSRI
jgi:hypothetical protein